MAGVGSAGPLKQVEDDAKKLGLNFLKGQRDIVAQTLTDAQGFVDKDLSQVEPALLEATAHLFPPSLQPYLGVAGVAAAPIINRLEGIASEGFKRVAGAILVRIDAALAPVEGRLS